MVRKILAVVTGIIAGMVAMFLGVAISAAIYGPEDPEILEDPAAFREFVEGMPPTAFLLVLVAHFAGTLIGAAICALVAGQRWTTGAIIIGGVFLLGGIGNLIQVPHPTWFAPVDLLLYLPAAWLGNRLAGRRSGSAGGGA